MKFEVERADYSGGKPCDKAIREKVTHVDVRSTHDPKLVPVAKGDETWWYADGRNHRVVEGCINRDLERDGWTLELDPHKFFELVLDYRELSIKWRNAPELPLLIIGRRSE